MSAGDVRSGVGRVRGLDAAKEGGEEWIKVRVGSLAILLLGSWLVASLLFLPSLDHATLAEWLRGPSAVVPMVLFIIVSFHHALEGMREVIDDYVEDAGNRFALNTLLLFLAVGGAALALFALLRIALGGSA
jgi:succinate dehydrogenase / fumarate reductase membrane anchor subunit